ncbi:MAG: type II toxin-antitoxin system RelE/ParE family toxin [Nitrosomonas sp.]|uniref:type II toxin-antitoxin system RelE/ParE family toxin n=1 Tax=uncultured Nitrosomonas sp. TaxID=156424 RepID=UPI0025628B3F|nr:type II toxin-antitoxin system RelE/ParE family toxin [uncultured Nitrosomonas sp.]MBC6963236.1 type II toxin-antitoxin system RelE/ParE family toxin [Nitrosomonas sp.]MDL1864330.1 type II toxin-antitoxin system RelE/ParE family toxin [Betaproteobacteria bacterium PRO5]
MNECEIIQSETFRKWLSKVKDGMAVMRIGAGIRRMSAGNFGNCKPVRDGISELRIDHGPGYRIYYMRKGPIVIVLLAGGDKSTQDADIERAITIAKEWKE